MFINSMLRRVKVFIGDVQAWGHYNFTYWPAMRSDLKLSAEQNYSIRQASEKVAAAKEQVLLYELMEEGAKSSLHRTTDSTATIREIAIEQMVQGSERAGELVIAAAALESEASRKRLTASLLLDEAKTYRNEVVAERITAIYKIDQLNHERATRVPWSREW